MLPERKQWNHKPAMHQPFVSTANILLFLGLGVSNIGLKIIISVSIQSDFARAHSNLLR